MERHAIMTIRWSILSRGSRRSWPMGRTDFERYRAALFAPERLERRLALFEAITLPSLRRLAARTPAGLQFTVQCMVSEELPVPIRRQLDAMVEDCAFIRIIPYPSEGRVDYDAILRAETEALTEKALIASIRLDDDDALSEDFLHVVDRFLRPEFEEYFVSPSMGYLAQIEGGPALSRLRLFHRRLSSTGLFRVMRKERLESVYAVSHAKPDLQFPTILLSSSPLFLRSAHDSNSSRVKLSRSNYPSIERSDWSSILSSFGLEGLRQATSGSGPWWRRWLAR